MVLEQQGKIPVPSTSSPPALGELVAGGGFWRRRWFIQQELCRAEQGSGALLNCLSL